MDELGRMTVSQFRESPKIPLMLVLDNIRSASNVGSIFRTADSFGLAGIHLCGYTAQPPHREILKTALGATETVAWKHHPDTVGCLNELIAQGWTVCSLEQTNASTDLAGYQPRQDEKIALVLGNEVTGVSDSALQLSMNHLEIKQFGTKHSLNVAVCAGIAVFHLSTMLRNNQN